jgi:hypothetical protein
MDMVIDLPGMTGSQSGKKQAALPMGTGSI